MSEPNIELMENGPILIKGPGKYVNADGQAEDKNQNWIALCRCGHSAIHPFCDATHKEKGFEAAKGEIHTS